LKFFAHTQRVGLRHWVARARGEETQSNRYDSKDSTHGSQPVTVLGWAAPSGAVFFCLFSFMPAVDNHLHGKKTIQRFFSGQ